MRDFLLYVPGDCCASNHAEDNDYALKQMKSILKADIRPSTELDWEEIKRRSEKAEGTSQKEAQDKVTGHSQSKGKPGSQHEVEPQPEQLSAWKA